MVNRIAKRSTSKFLAMGGAAMALSLWTTRAARADDGQVVQQALNLDVAEEQMSRAVKPKLGSPEAWSLADRIGSDYAALDRELTALAGAVPGSGGDATGDAADLGELSNLSGEALDKAYVDREVKAHETMIAAIDSQLLPAAKSDEARGGLLDLRAEATVHLAHARNIQRAQQERAIEDAQRADISKEVGQGLP
jgi:putative membrane protein